MHSNVDYWIAVADDLSRLGMAWFPVLVVPCIFFGAIAFLSFMAWMSFGDNIRERRKRKRIEKLIDKLLKEGCKIDDCRRD